MTDSEKTQIVNQVLAAIQTNSRSVMQLTPVSSLGSGDWFEISGGKRISYSVLSSLISSLLSDDLDELRSAIAHNTLRSASITCTATTATLDIATSEKTISCVVPIATDDTSGLITAEMKRHLDSAYEISGSALEKAEDALLGVAEANNEIALMKKVAGSVDISAINGVKALSDTPAVYRVTKSGSLGPSNVGVLFSFRKPNGAIPIQVMLTAYSIDDSGDFVDEKGKPTLYYRFCDIAKPVSEQWTKWAKESVSPEDFESRTQRQGSLLSGLYSALGLSVTIDAESGVVDVSGTISEAVLPVVPSDLTNLEDSLINRISETSGALSSEIDALRTSLHGEAGARAANDGVIERKITDEAIARSDADTALGGRIDAEAAARNAAIGAEATARAGGDAVRMFVNADVLLGSGRRSVEVVAALIDARADLAAYMVEGVVVTFTGQAGLESWQWSGTNWLNRNSWVPYSRRWQQVADEDTMQDMIDRNLCDPNTIYYTVED